jgi:hypothetical protein
VSDRHYFILLLKFLIIFPLFNNPDAFTVYDLNGDGYISREEMFQMLKTSIIKVKNRCLFYWLFSQKNYFCIIFLKQPTEEDPDEGIKDLVEIALKKMVNFFSITDDFRIDR